MSKTWTFAIGMLVGQVQACLIFGLRPHYLLGMLAAFFVYRTVYTITRFCDKDFY